MSLLGSLKRRSAVSPAGRLDDRAVDGSVGAARSHAAPSRAVRQELPQVVIVDGGPAETIGDLLLAIASGDDRALGALESRIGGLVRVNVRRVLQDAARSDAVTQQFFAEVHQEAVEFDPDRDRPDVWLLTRAHRRAIDGSGSVPQVANGPTSQPRSPDPIVAPDPDRRGDHAAAADGADPREVRGDPTLLLHL